jgi:hypothetical protein
MLTEVSSGRERGSETTKRGGERGRPEGGTRSEENSERNPDGDRKGSEGWLMRRRAKRSTRRALGGGVWEVSAARSVKRRKIVDIDAEFALSALLDPLSSALCDDSLSLLLFNS